MGLILVLTIKYLIRKIQIKKWIRYNLSHEFIQSAYL